MPDQPVQQADRPDYRHGQMRENERGVNGRQSRHVKPAPFLADRFNKSERERQNRRGSVLSKQE